jgi:dihydroorotase (multifunctional complex type)
VFDLGVEGGTVVTSRQSRPANVYIDDGRIARITKRRAAARNRIDAHGLLVMPGMVDAHVHFMDPSAPDREDFITGSAAAAHAGVTTVIEHTHSGPVRTVDDLRAKVAYVTGRSQIDFALAAHAWPGEAELVTPLWEAGVAFVKAFTCTTHGVAGHDPADLFQLFKAISDANAIALVHCEDESLLDAAERGLRSAGRADGGVLPVWRSREAEEVAVASVAQLAASANAEVVVAHASHLEVVGLARPNCRVETCPQYLTLLENEVLERGALRKFTPPARARSRHELALMWEALASGAIDYVSSDHAPATIEQKTSTSIWNAHFGLPGIDTTFAILLDAAHRGWITYERVVAVYSEMPARIYGLHPRKGSLSVGADADLVLVDPKRRWTVSDRDIVSKAGWSPFSGRTLVGRAVLILLRGRQPERGSGAFITGRGGAHPAS